MSRSKIIFSSLHIIDGLALWLKFVFFLLLRELCEYKNICIYSNDAVVYSLRWTRGLYFEHNHSVCTFGAAHTGAEIGGAWKEEREIKWQRKSKHENNSNIPSATHTPVSIYLSVYMANHAAPFRGGGGMQSLMQQPAILLSARGRKRPEWHYRTAQNSFSDVFWIRMCSV